MPLLECSGLVKDYPGKRAVDGIDFYVERGDVDTLDIRRLNSFDYAFSNKISAYGQNTVKSTCFGFEFALSFVQTKQGAHKLR